jgi:hypothetical protein
MIDRSGEPVRELVSRQAQAAGGVTLVWDGRDDDGVVVPEGPYRPRVRLHDERRTITLPNPIRVDVTPPRFERFSIRPRLFSPDGDGRNDKVTARYRVSERARVSLFVDGVRLVLKRGSKREGAVTWFGRINGEPVPPGPYVITLGARDLAGNTSRRTTPRSVVARYVALGRNVIETRPNARFAVLVSSDARRVRWQLGQRTGTTRPGTLRLRAPSRPGRYTLTVTANGQTARAAVFVRRDPAT